MQRKRNVMPACRLEAETEWQAHLCQLPVEDPQRTT